MFYYSVVMGWTLRFLVASITGAIPTTEPSAFWDSFAGSEGAFLTHVIAVGLAVFVVAKGVRGIETAAKVLIPSLVVLIMILAVRAITLPGASAGLAFLFTPNLAGLGEVDTWLQALTQNAWDTGAGWGLVVTYAVYMRSREDTALNAFMVGFGNNSMSLLAGIMVICTVFSAFAASAVSLCAGVGLDPAFPAACAEEVLTTSGNEGLTFIWMPQLFAQIPGGRVLMIFFFLALVFAAWSSLVAMIELASRILMDLGMTRTSAITSVAVGGIGFGAVSALNMNFLQNQDWVWGVGLMLSGFFFAFAILRYGVTKWRERFINTGDSDIHIGAWWDWAIRLVVVQTFVLMGWWLWGARGEDFAATWTLLSSYNVGTVLIQWAIALAIFLLFNKRLARRSAEQGVCGPEDIVDQGETG